MSTMLFLVGILLSIASGVCAAFYGLAAANAEVRSERMAWICAAMWAFSCAIQMVISTARFAGGAA